MVMFGRAVKFDGANRCHDAMREIEQIEKHFGNTRFIVELVARLTLHKSVVPIVCFLAEGTRSSQT